MKARRLAAWMLSTSVMLAGAGVVPAVMASSAQAATGTAASTTAVSTKNNPVAVGQSAKVGIRVRPVIASAVVPTGTVAVSVDGGAPVSYLLVAGGASVREVFTTAGPHTIAGAYSGDAVYAPSSSPLKVNVTAGVAVNTTTTLSSSVNPSVIGQAVKFTAVVKPVSGSSVPTGSVTFTVDGVVGAPVALVAGKATETVATLGLGGHPVSAAYGGDSLNNASPSAVLTQTVNQSGTAVTLTSSANPSLAGASVTITAQVSPVHPGKGNPTGTVTFSVNGVPGAPVAVAFGKARLITGALTAGTYTITATFSGDANFTTSTSAVALSQVVK